MDQHASFSCAHSLLKGLSTRASSVPKWDAHWDMAKLLDSSNTQNLVFIKKWIQAENLALGGKLFSFL